MWATILDVAVIVCNLAVIVLLGISIARDIKKGGK